MRIKEILTVLERLGDVKLSTNFDVGYSAYRYLIIRAQREVADKDYLGLFKTSTGFSGNAAHKNTSTVNVYLTSVAEITKVSIHLSVQYLSINCSIVNCSEKMTRHLSCILSGGVQSEGGGRKNTNSFRRVLGGQNFFQLESNNAGI